MCKSSVFMLGVVVLGAAQVAIAESRATSANDTADPASAIAVMPLSENRAPRPNPCTDPKLQPNSMSPTWNIQAVPVQCGALETDNLSVLQPMEPGIAQWALFTTAKYGHYGGGCPDGSPSTPAEPGR